MRGDRGVGGRGRGDAFLVEMAALSGKCWRCRRRYRKKSAKKRNIAKHRVENGERTRIGSVFTQPREGLRHLVARLWQAVAGCGRLRQPTAACAATC